MTYHFGPPDDRDWPWMLQAHARTCWESLPPWRRRAVSVEAIVERLTTMEADLRSDHGHARLVLVARGEDETPAGFIWVEETRSGTTGEAYAFVTEVFVTEDNRRWGLGRRLLEQAEAWARGAAMRRLVLNVAVDNGAARSLYESAGYAVEATRMGKEIGTQSSKLT